MNPMLQNYLMVGAILFILGAIGFITRRNLFVMVLSAEMMLQGVAINLIAFGHHHGNYRGQVFIVFILTVAACEAALGLALILAIYHRRKSLDVAVWQSLGEEGADRDAPLDGPIYRENDPRLLPPGTIGASEQAYAVNAGTSNAKESRVHA